MKKREVILGCAKRIDDENCVCPKCIPLWESAKNHSTETRLPTLALDEDFINYVRVASSDKTIRDTIYSIVRLDSEQRVSVIENLIISLHGRGAPSELIDFFRTLKDDAVARQVSKLIYPTSAK